MYIVHTTSLQPMGTIWAQGLVAALLGGIGNSRGP
jgi:hypothetical protein